MENLKMEYKEFSSEQLAKITLNGEISAFDEAIKQNNILKEQLEDSRNALVDELMLVIDAMGVAFDQRTEAIEKMRSFRKVIERECNQSINSIKELNNLLSNDRLASMREFVELIERLKK